MEKKFKLYRVTADYRVNNQSKPHYYVFATSKSHAKTKFSEHISWLKIYKVEEIDNDEYAEYIETHPYEYICINSEREM